MLTAKVFILAGMRQQFGELGWHMTKVRAGAFHPFEYDQHHPRTAEQIRAYFSRSCDVLC